MPSFECIDVRGAITNCVVFELRFSTQRINLANQPISDVVFIGSHTLQRVGNRLEFPSQGVCKLRCVSKCVDRQYEAIEVVIFFVANAASSVDNGDDIPQWVVGVFPSIA